MSDDGGPDEVVAAVPDMLTRAGADLGELSNMAKTVKRDYDECVAQNPPERAFGSHGQIAHTLWEKAHPLVRAPGEILDGFHLVLGLVGDGTHAVGGAFRDADTGALDAARGPSGGGRRP